MDVLVMGNYIVERVGGMEQGAGGEKQKTEVRDQRSEVSKGKDIRSKA
jgi:hypothetical protein